MDEKMGNGIAKSDPLFQMTDGTGQTRLVRIVKNYIEGLSAESFQAAVADVVDVDTNELLPQVPLTRLIPRDEPG